MSLKTVFTFFLGFFWLLAGSVFAAEVNVYSARGEDLIKPALDQFTQDTGITVNLITENASALIRRIESEGVNSPADVLLTVDAGRLYRAKEADIFQSIDSATLKARIPVAYRDVDDKWFGLSLRSRVIMYDKSRVDASELSTYEDLANPKWRNEICIRSSSNIYNQSLLASLIAHVGAGAAEEWTRGLVANFARSPQGGDRDQIRAAIAGQCKLAVSNTYYLAGMLISDVEADVEVAKQVGVFFPNQGGDNESERRGAHMNVSGAGVVKTAPNKTEAVQLLEFLTGDFAQKFYSEVNNEYSVRSDIPVSEALRGFGDFKADSLNLDTLGRNNDSAVRMADRAGWR
jgi:iron(III) transport system substrate-binding protein